MKRSLSILFVILSIVCCANAQSKDDIKLVKQLVNNPSQRKPLPSIMTDDSICNDFVYIMEKMDESVIESMLDSARTRQKENNFLDEHIDLVLNSEQAAAFREKMIREKLRLDYFVEEYDILKDNRRAEQREMPESELVYLYYSMSGMMNYPYMPASITRMSEDKAIVKYAPPYYEKSFETSADYLQELREIVRDEKLYQLHGSYRMRTCKLPDFYEQIEILDGMSWSFEAKFADGTTISSGGERYPQQDVYKIQKALENIIIQYIQNHQQKK